MYRVYVRENEMDCEMGNENEEFQLSLNEKETNKEERVEKGEYSNW